MKRQLFKLSVVLIAFIGSVYVISNNQSIVGQHMNAATNFTKGNKVYIGNESYTIIDPNAMTLLADQATDDGEMTWDDAVASLANLPNNYGELGEKLVTGHISLPKTGDLTPITNDNTLNTVDPIASDWWLGDESVDNRSKFVGANTNSLVTEVSGIKNILDMDNRVCKIDQSVVEQGLKPTKTGNDPDKSETLENGEGSITSVLSLTNSDNLSTVFYAERNCQEEKVSGGYQTQYLTPIDGSIPFSKALTLSQWATVDPQGALFTYYQLMQSGAEEYVNNYIKNPSQGYDKKFPIDYKKGVCYNVDFASEEDEAKLGLKSFKPKFDMTMTLTFKNASWQAKTYECAGHAQTAGESSVRPLITLDKNKIAYTGSSKPSYHVNALINQAVPEVNDNSPYLTMTDADLGIALDTNDPNVSGTTLSVDPTNAQATIPVTLSGTTSGDRYVSAVATTKSGEQYGVLGLINGTTGSVQLDLSNLPSSGKVNLTLYQEVDEGTNTTYRGNGTPITLDLSIPIKGITLTPNYPAGKSNWNVGDSGIASAGAKTGTLTFSGGSSGVIDPTSGKDYTKWEIVDASGNATTDANFRINGNELIAKKKIASGTYTLSLKVTDNDNQTFVDTVTITVDKAGNPFDWNTTVKNTTSLYYGDTLTLGVTGVKESAAISYAPASHVSGNVFTAIQPIANIDITASAAATASYGATTITHSVEIKKRPLSVQVQLKDAAGKWQNSVAIQQGLALPDHQVIVDTSDASSKGLAAGDTLSDAKLGTVQYEYRQGSTVVNDPSTKAGTYELYAVYNSDYYTISVKAATLVVNGSVTITDANKGQFYEFQLKDGSLADITKWQKDDIIIHPKHSDYNKMKVDSGTYQSGDYTYSKEGTNTVSLSFQNNSGGITSTINETLKIDKTDPTIAKVEFMEDGAVKSEGSGVFQYLFKNTADIKISANDNESGIARYLIQLTPLKSDGSVDSSKQVIQQNTPSTGSTFTYTVPTQGYYLVEVSVEDQVGRTTSYNAKKIKINNQQMTLQVKGYLNNDSTKPYDGTKWTNQSITLKLNASDHSTLTNQQISFDNSTWQAMPNGIYTIANTSSVNDQTYYMKATNVDGEEISTSMAIKLDVDKPENLTIQYKDVAQGGVKSFLRAISFNHIFTKEQDAIFSATDALSGIDYYEYSIQEKDSDGNDVGSAVKGKGTSYRLKDKNYTITVVAYDKAGNMSDLVNDSVQVDTAPPTINGVKDHSEYKQYYLPRFVSVEDQVSGVKEAYYEKDGGAAITINDNVKIMGIGNYKLYAQDNAGNDITINFKIVPLPDIETEIDGSDESKEIIDQVIKELDEVKDKIDETEKEDYEEWIHDALEKWESLRKKVVETDDKTAKVVGQGDTSFDPKVELIVDPISENDIPKLPKKALAVYDVYLRKGMTRIQPDGSIKVYLPYEEETKTLGEAMGGAKSDAAPIVYRIDTDNKVTQIDVQQEGNFVTFITDTLVKYAISNEAQESNENNSCVVGKDDTINTSDDVCGKPNNSGDEPQKQPDGSVKVPEGGKVEFPNGSEIDTPDGAIIKPDGTVVLPDGTEYDPDGNKKNPDKQCELEGTKINIDTNHNGIPDVNIDTDKDCIADLNIDMNGDNIPDINIDSDGDGKADINIDTDDDGKADINIAVIKNWNPNKVVSVNGFMYETMGGINPYLNIDVNGDLKPDYNIDDDGDGIPDRNLLGDDELSNHTGGAFTGDQTKWTIWWILVILTGITMTYSIHRKKRRS